MPIVPFSELPDSARVWIFGSDAPLAGAAADTLLASVDQFLSEWRAHGVPLRAAREWRDDRFLAVGVDVTEENASGCSIDGLFRTLQQLERVIGSKLVGGGRVFYRADSTVVAATRDEFVARAKAGRIAKDTPVFDMSLTSAADWRAKFEQPASDSWASAYFV
ncbi:MAG: hypothetical protein ACREPM_12285 [Gemmatimonadaceae bacterium]